VSESGIKDKSKLLRFLYRNPEKLAIKLSKFIQDTNEELCPLAKIKGEGHGFYHSMNNKKLVRVCRNSEFYLLPWVHEDKDKCYIYTHHNWFVGCILIVLKDEVEVLGYN
jgi:hypothetical protein